MTGILSFHASNVSNIFLLYNFTFIEFYVNHIKVPHISSNILSETKI